MPRLHEGRLSTSGQPNGRPLSRPYRYGGDGTTKTPEEVMDFVRGVRARIAGPEHAPLPDSLAPPPEVAHEREELMVLRPHVRIVPTAVNGRRKPFYVAPPALTKRLAELASPPPPPATTTTRRCRRCGYLLTRCDCKGRRRK